MAISAFDIVAMEEALLQARKASFIARPNPAVGCVIARDGQVLGRGHTQRVGGPHAERSALAAVQQAGHSCRGATAYVTLEPCNHHGRTPPCVDGLLEAGIPRVVASMADPFEQVSGEGFARLRAAGVEVEVGLLAEQAWPINRGFFTRITKNTPWFVLKSAASVDGRTAMANGDSQWITGPQAREDVHRLRAASCAVLTGVGSVLQDNSRLSARPSAALDFEPPAKLVLDSALRTPPDAAVLRSPGRTVIVTTLDADEQRASALQANGAEVVRLRAEGDEGDEGDERVPLPAFVQWCSEQSFNQVMIEAGATVAGAFLGAELIDEWWLYSAPLLMGDAARPLLHWPLQSMSAAQRWQVMDRACFGDDLRVRLTRQIDPHTEPQPQDKQP